jgi:uncharacterized protein (DUF1499 family)
MKTVSIILPILIVTFIGLLFNFRDCVCSEHKDDANHYIAPIILPQNTTVDTFSLLNNVIQEMGGNVQVESCDYLAATFTSAIFKFVDDLEIRIDLTQEVIHIRSASRVGYSDMGVNKKRTELLKKLFNNEVSEANKSFNTAPKNGAH